MSNVLRITSYQP